LAEHGSAGTPNRTGTKIVLGSLQDAAGEAECATTQTAHCASSEELECWWATEANANTDISSRQSHAIGFKTDRIKMSPSRTADATPKLASTSAGISHRFAQAIRWQSSGTAPVEILCYNPQSRAELAKRAVASMQFFQPFWPWQRAKRLVQYLQFPNRVSRCLQVHLSRS